MTIKKNTRSRSSDYDIIVAGGGPAGCTAATLLAQYGYRVLLLEQGRHPRFHIGESMLPHSEPVMHRLGIDWCDGNIFKRGAVFVDESSGKRMFFQLSGQHNAVQVERSSFDRKLFENAQAHGAIAHQEEKVLEVECQPDTVALTTDKRHYSGRYLVDATGRKALMGRQHRVIERLNNLGRFALYSHFSQVRGRAVDELYASGNILILMVDRGWLWVIPLRGGCLSVGLVSNSHRPEGMAPETLFHRYVDDSPLIKALLQGATQEGAVRSEANFSYVNRRRFGLRYVCCGDAAGFLDPVFSSGVFLALTGAARVADRIHQGFEQGREADPALHQVDDSEYDLGFRTMQVFVERFYHTDLISNVFFEAHRDDNTKQNISELLAGNLWSGDNAWQEAILKGRYASMR